MDRPIGMFDSGFGGLTVARALIDLLPDEEWGERVCAAIKWKLSDGLSLESLRVWCKERLAVYKIPSRLLSNVDLPRNAMGKVTKKDVQALFTK